MRHWFIVLVLVLSFTQSARADPLRLSVLFQWQRYTLRQDAAVLFSLEIPFQRLASPRLPTLLAELPVHGLGEDAQKPTPAVVVPAPAPKKPRPLPARSVRRLFKAALERKTSETADERLDGMASRVRAAAALPELMLRAARSSNESLRLSPSGMYVYDYTQTGGAGLIFEARATWKLDRLVFADEELHVERLRVQRERSRERVLEVLLRHLFAWQRARARLAAATDALPDDERATLEVEFDNASAALDVLTDGVFSEEIARLGLQTP